LRTHQLRQMGVAVGGNPVRTQRDNLAEGDIETVHGLQGQTVDKIDADRLESRLARRSDQRVNLLLALLAIDRGLHVRVKVLHAETQAIEAQLAQRLNLLGADGARVDFDGKLMVIAVIHVKRLVQTVHQVSQLFAGQIGRRATAQVQLGEFARTVEQRSLHNDFTLEVGQVFDGAVGFLGNDFVAGAVVTKALAERYVDIDRQGFRHRRQVAVG